MAFVHMLVEERHEPVPKDIEVHDDWGEVTIVTDEKDLVTGKHMLLEGSKEGFKAWLGGTGDCWVGVDVPSVQKFEAMHIE